MSGILLDENWMNKKVANALSKLGFWVTAIEKLGMRHYKDHRIMDYARKNRLLIITKDKGEFANLYNSPRYFSRKHPPGILIIDVPNQKMALKTLEAFLESDKALILSWRPFLIKLTESKVIKYYSDGEEEFDLKSNSGTIMGYFNGNIKALRVLNKIAS